MAMARALLGLTSIAALLQLAMGASYTVGGQSGGWDLSSNLVGWAASQKFTVGDSLTFSYGPSHDVVEVSKPNYDSCTATNPIQSYNGGSTVVKLSAPGKRYFICGTPGHCQGGMKVEIDVVSAAVATPPSAASPPKPLTPSLKSPPPKARGVLVAPATAPSISPSSRELPPALLSPSVSEPPVAHTPEAAAPRSSSAASVLGQQAKIAMGLGVGMLLIVVLAL